MTQYAEKATWALVLADGSELPLTPQEGVTVDQVQGAGMPPVANVTTPYALLDGAAWQRAVAQPRVVTLVLRAVGGCRDGLARVRRALVGAVSPHRGPLPLTLRYYGPEGVRDLAAYYDAGLEGGGHTGWSEEIGLRLLAVDPYWYGPEAAEALDPSESLAVSGVVARGPEGWDALNGGLVYPDSAPQPYAIAEAANGDVLVGGLFYQDAFGNPMPHLARWDGTTWAAGMGAIAGWVRAIIVDADGNIYIGGDFVIAPDERIAMWDGTAWQSLDGGMGATVWAMAMGPDGSIYAGGDFTTAGTTPASRVARWDGSAWHALGGGFPGRVRALAIGLDGSVYAGGEFSKAGGAVADHIARWDGSSWHELSTGTDDDVVSLTVAANGDLYAGGSFALAGATPALRIARWDGAAWHPLGSGLGSELAPSVPRSMTVGPDGNLYVVGNFYRAGEVPIANRMAVWNGYSWAPLDIILPEMEGPIPIEAPTTVVQWIDGTLYIGFISTGTAFAPGYTTVTNPGNARVHPVVTVTATGGQVTLRSLANETTGQRIWFDLTVLAGETITIDTRPGSAGLRSDYRGTALGANPLAGSQLASFVLDPGENVVSLFADNTPGGTATAQVRFRPAYWSTD